MKRAIMSGLLCLAVFPGAAARAEAMLPGGNAKEPYTIDAAKLDYFEKEQKLIYTGDVIATQGQTRLKGAVMTIYLDKSANGGNDRQMRRIEVLGPVTVVQNGKIGTGDTALYDKTENKWYLVGNVTLTEGDDVTQGQKLIYDLSTSKALVDSGQQGRIKSVFTPKEGGDKAAEAKPAETKPKDAARKDAKPKPAATKPAGAKTAAKRPDEPAAARP